MAISNDINQFIRDCQQSSISKEVAKIIWKFNNNGKISDAETRAIDNSALKNASYSTNNTSFKISETDFSKKVNLGDLVSVAMKASEATQMPSISDEMLKIDDFQKLLTNSKGELASLSEIGNNFMKAAINQVGLYIQEQSALLTEVNEKMGLTGDYATMFRDILTDANPRLLQLGIGFDELVTASQNLVKSTGNFAALNQQTWERAGEVAKAYVGDLSSLVEMYPSFRKVGLGAFDATEKIAQAGKSALSVGLQSQKLTKDLAGSLDKLNQYGFKKGIDGLAEMTRKAQEFRMSMDSVFQIADKVMNPEGALDLAANLQVLGGAIGDFNDPLKLMYMATNNVEGLQDALKDAASTLTTYNEEQGRFEITGVNLRRAKEMATQLGITYSELANGAVAAAERSKAASDLMSQGLTLKEDQKQFITNIAQMKGGKMVVELKSDALKQVFGANEIALENMTQKQADELLRMQDQFKEMSPEEIIRQQATDIRNLLRDTSSILAELRKTSGRYLGNAINDLAINIKSVTGIKSSLADLSNMMNKDIRAKVTGRENDYYKHLKEILDELNNYKNDNKKQTTEKPQPKKAEKPVFMAPEDLQKKPDTASVKQPNEQLQELVDKTGIHSDYSKTIASNTLQTSNGVAQLNTNILDLNKNIPKTNNNQPSPPLVSVAQPPPSQTVKFDTSSFDAYFNSMKSKYDEQYNLLGKQAASLNNIDSSTMNTVMGISGLQNIVQTSNAASNTKLLDDYRNSFLNIQKKDMTYETRFTNNSENNKNKLNYDEFIYVLNQINNILGKNIANLNTPEQRENTPKNVSVQQAVYKGEVTKEITSVTEREINNTTVNPVNTETAQTPSKIVIEHNVIFKAENIALDYLKQRILNIEDFIDAFKKIPRDYLKIGET